MPILLTFILGLLSILLFIYVIFYMKTMLSYTRQQRVLMSMQLKAIKEIAEKQGVEIDLSAMQKSVEDSM